MRARGRLTRWPRRHQPHAAAREAIALIQRYLERGASAEELAQAQANLAALNEPRQCALALKVRQP